MKNGSLNRSLPPDNSLKWPNNRQKMTARTAFAISSCDHVCPFFSLSAFLKEKPYVREGRYWDNPYFFFQKNIENTYFYPKFLNNYRIRLLVFFAIDTNFHNYNTIKHILSTYNDLKAPMNFISTSSKLFFQIISASFGFIGLRFWSHSFFLWNILQKIFFPARSRH